MRSDILDIRKKRAAIVLKELKQLFPRIGTILKFSNNWELLVAVMLSAQTADVQVNKVTEALFRKYPYLRDYAEANFAAFEKAVSGVNYYKTKARNVIASAGIIATKHSGSVPDTLQDLMLLPGVGRKTALVVLGNAYGIVEGIAVDTHVQRLARKFRLSEEQDSEKIEQDLQLLFPRSEWFDLTNRLIAYGRAYSPARLTEPTDPIMLKLKSSGCLPGKKMGT